MATDGHEPILDKEKKFHSLKDDEKARKTFLKKPGTSKHDLTLLNSKLAAAASEEGYQDYCDNQKARETLFS